MDKIQLSYGSKAPKRSSLLLTTRLPGVPENHLIHAGMMKGWINLGVVQYENPAP